jgi:hypothetical protein
MDLATVLVDEQSLSQDQEIAYKNAAETAAGQTHDTSGTTSQYVVKTYQELGNTWKGALFNPATPARAIGNPRELDQYILDKTGFSYDDGEDYERVRTRLLNNGLFIVRADSLRGGITRKKRKQRKQKRTKKGRSTRRR